MRTIIGITTAGCENPSQTQTNAILVALCDDGSLWISDHPYANWQRIPNVPQDEDA